MVSEHIRMEDRWTIEPLHDGIRKAVEHMKAGTVKLSMALNPAVTEVICREVLCGHSQHDGHYCNLKRIELDEDGNCIYRERQGEPTP